MNLKRFVSSVLTMFMVLASMPTMILAADDEYYSDGSYNYSSAMSLLEDYLYPPVILPEGVDRETYNSTREPNYSNPKSIAQQNLVNFYKSLDKNSDNIITIDEYSVPINEETFPDQDFREYVTTAEINETGSTERLSPATLFRQGEYLFMLTGGYNSFNKVDGIEYFNAHLGRILLNDQQITEVDLSDMSGINILEIGATPIERVNLSNSSIEICIGDNIRNGDWYELLVSKPISLEELNFFDENYSFEKISTETPREEWSSDVLDRIDEMGIYLHERDFGNMEGDVYAISYGGVGSSPIACFQLNGEGLTITLSDGDYFLPSPSSSSSENQKNEDQQDDSQVVNNETNQGENQEEEIVNVPEDVTEQQTDNQQTESASEEIKPAPAPVSNEVAEMQDASATEEISVSQEVSESQETSDDITVDSVANVGSFINRCYSIVLGRDADDAGYNSWVDSLINGKTCGAQIGYGFIFSEEYTSRNTTDEEYINDLYTLHFGREADEAGFAYWKELLESGTSREEIFAGFANSNEFYNLCGDYGVVAGTYIVGIPYEQQGGVNSFVARLYKVCLNRLPDQAGQAVWVQKLIHREETGASCAYGFIFSQEYTNRNLDNTEFVKNMYKALFGREADEAGLNYWVEQLNAGIATREAVFTGFTGSEEFTNLCSSYGIIA